MTCDYQRTGRPVTALPMIMRWTFDVPSIIVKLAGSAGSFREWVACLSWRLSAQAQHGFPASADLLGRCAEFQDA